METRSSLSVYERLAGYSERQDANFLFATVKKVLTGLLKRKNPPWDLGALKYFLSAIGKPVRNITHALCGFRTEEIRGLAAIVDTARHSRPSDPILRGCSGGSNQRVAYGLYGI